MCKNKKAYIFGYAVCAAGFALCLIEALGGYFNTQELALFHLFNPLMQGGFGTVVRYFTYLGNWESVVLALAALLAVPNKFFRKNIAFPTAAATALAWLFNKGLKAIVARPRPQVAAFVAEREFSFTSGHTVTACALCLVLFIMVNRYLKKGFLRSLLKTIFIAYPLLLGVSRILLGAHYPSDVLGAMFMGAAVALTASIITKKQEVTENENPNL